MFIVLSFVALFSAMSFAEAPLSASELTFQRSVSTFEKIRTEKIAIASNSKHAPILLQHGQKTEYAIVLFHGLYESPRTLEGVARGFYKMGFNVYLPLLPGHWPKKLSVSDQVTYKDWLAETDRSIALAQKLGKKVLVGGFSLGGILAVEATLKYPKVVKGLYLWAPAFAMSGGASLAASLGALLGLDGNRGVQADGVDVPYASLKMASQLFDLNKYINKKYFGKSGAPEDSYLRGALIGSQIKVPTFVAFSDDDEAISRAQVRRFFKFLTVKKELMMFYGIDHTSTPKDRGDASAIKSFQYNIRFDDLMRNMNDFFERSF